MAIGGAPLSIELRTFSLDLLRKQLGIELREFHDLQYRKMRIAVRYVRRVVTEEVSTNPRIKRRSGRLRSGIRGRVKRVGQGEFVGRVWLGPRAWYGRFLELGASGPGDRVLEPRPFFEPAADRVRGRVVRILGESFNVFT